MLVIGASSDVGNAYAEKYESNYDFIIAHYHSLADKLLGLKNRIGDKLKLYQADFLDEISTREFIDKIREGNCIPTHVLHLTAPKVVNNKFHKIPWDSYQKGFDIQFRPIVALLKEFLPSMAKNKYGKVVFVLRFYTLNAPPKYLTYYIVLKDAVLGFMKSLAVEYADKILNINTVSPSMIETKFLENIPDLMVQQNAVNRPLKRNANVEDIIPTINFLLSGRSAFITGQNLVVAGGTVI